MSITAYIGLGSNLDQPVEQLRQALGALQQLPQTRVSDFSSLYQSKAVGPGEQPDYINAVARLETTLEARQLLDLLHKIEASQNRVRDIRWGPRTLDLDILTYGTTMLDTPELCIPHPRIAERNFVLYPLAELDAALVIPGLGPVQQLCAQIDEEGLVRQPQLNFYE